MPQISSPIRTKASGRAQSHRARIERSSRGSMSMLRTLRRVLVVVVLLEAVAIVLFRMRWRPAIDAIRQFNRRALNPVMLKMAGKRHWYAAAVHHVGRTSGRAYATPGLAERGGGFFYIPLPYGSAVDWCRNLLAAGSATLESNGVNYRVA